MEKQHEAPIVICLCSDDNGVDFMLVAIKSIFITNKAENIDLHIFTDGFSQNNITLINKLADYYNRSIKIHVIDEMEYNNLPGCGDGYHFPKSILFRFSIPEILTDYNKALYLDTDIIVEHSLRELWNTDITDNSIACVIDAGITEFWDYIKYGLGFNPTRYFNSGVILMNLDYIREHNVKDCCLQWLIENPEKSKWADQTSPNFMLEGTSNISILSIMFS